MESVQMSGQSFQLFRRNVSKLRHHLCKSINPPPLPIVVYINFCSMTSDISQLCLFGLLSQSNGVSIWSTKYPEYKLSGCLRVPIRGLTSNIENWPPSSSHLLCLGRKGGESEGRGHSRGGGGGKGTSGGKENKFKSP